MFYTGHFLITRPMLTMRPILLAALLTFASGLVAQTLPEQVRQCAAIEGSEQRLACYDAISEGLIERVEESFGQEDELIADMVEAAPESIQVAIASIQRNADNQMIITLDNGQIWRQIDINRVTWEEGEVVEITRGMLNSFFMRSTEGGRRMRVSRAN